MGFSQDFLEKAILLFLTAGLSGFIIPYILKEIDERKLREQKIVDARRLQEQKEFDARKLQEQKEFDADLIRQNKLLEGQAELLDTLSELLWELQLLALAVSYYKVHPDPEKHELAFKNYDEKSWILFAKIRCEISKAAHLASDKKYKDLMAFFDTELIEEMDEKLMKLLKKNTSPEEWKEYYNWVIKALPKKIDYIVRELAQELRLSSPTVTV
ncbi:hypothetical protein [Nostoc sp.]|uniref:hypothetical protein n=1 Tax=Nostoc sp. TaxID=1180 RepID=UPI002FF56116